MIAVTRPVTYCLIPRELAPKLHELLRRHFAKDAGVEVVVEQREGAERRRGKERRQIVADEDGDGEGEPIYPGEERRHVRFPNGRRVSERRAEQAPAPHTPELPRRARRYADRLRFVRRMEPASLRAEDEDTQRLVARFQAGDRDDAFSGLYQRYFSRVHSYLRLAIKDSYEAEDLAQQTFIQVLQGLKKYERREQPFRSWLFAIARNQAADHFRRIHAIPVEDPTEYMTEEAQEELPEPELDVLGWITDSDLTVLVERLTPAQRQALALRYMLGLNSEEAGAVMGRSPESVRMLQSRAVNFLRERLNALGRVPKTSRRPPSRRIEKQARVLRCRRYGLSDPGPTG